MAVGDAEKGARLREVLDLFNCVAAPERAYVPHPWTDCNYADEFDCEKQAVFGIHRLGAATGKPVGSEYQACVAHVGEMLATDDFNGQWRVWSL